MRKDTWMASSLHAVQAATAAGLKGKIPVTALLAVSAVFGGYRRLKEVPDKMCSIYLYRIATQGGLERRGEVQVLDNGSKVADLSHESYVHYFAPPGEHSLQVVYKSDDGNQLEFTAHAGCVYFFHVQVKSFPFEVNVFKQVSPEFAEVRLKEFDDGNPEGLLIDYEYGEGTRTLNPTFVDPNKVKGRAGGDHTGTYSGSSAKLTIAKGASLAIMNLQAQGIDPGTANLISDIMATEIKNTGHFRLIERSQMESILKEQSAQVSGLTTCTEASCAVELGKLLNVEYLMIGTVGNLGSKIVVNLRLVNVETAEIAYAEKVTSSSLETIDVNIAQFAAGLQ